MLQRTDSVDANSSVAFGAVLYGHGGSAISDAPSVYVGLDFQLFKSLNNTLLTKVCANIFGNLL